MSQKKLNDHLTYQHPIEDGRQTNKNQNKPSDEVFSNNFFDCGETMKTEIKVEETLDDDPLKIQEKTEKITFDGEEDKENISVVEEFFYL